MDLKDIKIEDYNYVLPDEKIAKYPLAKRDESKLLLYNKGNINQNIFKNIADYLPDNSLLVANNTKVIRARLEFFKETGARIEVFCLEPHQPSDYSLSFSSTTGCQWTCIIGNLKKWKGGILTKDIQINGTKTSLQIERLQSTSEWHIVDFKWDNKNFTFSEIIENTGNIPIPPYLNRKSEESDLKTYQTVYSKHKGSVAAPTAGLHFTDDVFESLHKKGINLHEVTLHVGAGTFKPVKAENIGGHDMHTEHFIITEKTIPALINNIGNITAVGTTTVRTLESLYWLGVKLINNECTPGNLHISQWEAYENNYKISVVDALQEVHNTVIESELNHLNASTAIMIAPGYKFEVVNRIITNFHQPQSTLLLLVSAFIGDDWKKLYNHALTNDFRFLSYGDSCLLL